MHSEHLSTEIKEPRKIDGQERIVQFILLDSTYAIWHASVGGDRDDDPNGKPCPCPAVQAPRLGGIFARAHPDHRQEDQRHSHFRGRPAIDSGNPLLALYPRNAQVRPQRSEGARREVQCRPQVVSWRLAYTRQAQKDAKKLDASGLRPQAEIPLEILARNPFEEPHPFEKLVGELAGSYSRRINIHHRLVYQVLLDVKTVMIIRMWTHYE